MHDYHWEDLIRYLAGECPPDERAKINAWIKADPRHKTMTEELKRIWALTEGPPEEWDVDGAWEGVADRLDRRDAASNGPRMLPPRRTTLQHARRHREWAPFLRAAAVVAFVALGALLTIHLTGGESRVQSENKIFATERGQRATIHLGDGTRVHVNADSRLSVPPTFHADRREVHLAGEAYFDVAHDATRPFIIRAGSSVVQVLGTEFGVATYSTDELLRVVVVEGKVALRSRSASDESALLTAGQMGRISPEGTLLVDSDVEVETYVGWTEGRLHFDKTPMHEVIRRLERWYDVEIVLADSTLADLPLTTTLNNVSLRMALNILTNTMRLDYEHSGRRITLSPSERSSDH